MPEFKERRPTLLYDGKSTAMNKALVSTFLFGSMSLLCWVPSSAVASTHVPARVTNDASGDVVAGCKEYVPVGESSRGVEYGFLQEAVVYADAIPTAPGVRYTCRYYSKISTPTFEFKLDANEVITSFDKQGAWLGGEHHFACMNRSACFFTVSKAQ